MNNLPREPHKIDIINRFEKLNSFKKCKFCQKDVKLKNFTSHLRIEKKKEKKKLDLQRYAASHSNKKAKPMRLNKNIKKSLTMKHQKNQGPINTRKEKVNLGQNLMFERKSKRCSKCKKNIFNNSEICASCRKVFHINCTTWQKPWPADYKVCPYCFIEIASNEKFREILKIKHESNEIYIKDSKMYLTPPFPSAEQFQIMRKDIFETLSLRKVIFSDDITYKVDHYKKLNNSTHLKENIQFNQQWRLYKSRTRTLHYPPLRIIYSELKGFGVLANCFLRANTIICEYSGVVILNSETDRNSPNNFTIANRKEGDENLLAIEVKEFGNIGFLINGVNNKSGQSLETINCKVVCHKINNEIHLIMSTLKDIDIGEELLYDYNANWNPKSGFEPEYPTNNFNDVSIVHEEDNYLSISIEMD